MIEINTEVVDSNTDNVKSRRELVERVVRSPLFAKSKRLSSLLTFVCDMTLKGRMDEINEQRIGEAVFERSPSYDPAIDGIVRTQASRLRQRLEQYFSEEGSSEPVIIAIPRGAYVPSFENRPLPSEPPQQSLPGVSQPPNAVSVNPLPADPPLQRSVRQWAFWIPMSLGWVLAALLAMATFHYHRLLERASHTEPGGHPLWSHLFFNGSNTLFVPEDSGLVMWEWMMKRNLSLQEFTDGKFRETVPDSKDPLINVAAMLARRRYTAVVNLEALQLFNGIAISESSKLNIRYARDVRPNDLRDNNVVLLGAPEANSWVYLFEPNMNFVFENNRLLHTFAVLNRHPRNGEPAEWLAEPDPKNSVYAIVAFLPGLNERRNALIVAGTAMTGTECALNFIQDDKQLSPFLEKVRRPDGSIPHFEVVLGTHTVEGNALKAALLAWRVID